MREYLHPGVYVTEIVSGATSIEGVSTSTADLIGKETVTRLQRLATIQPPEWTEFNDHDPGVGLLELFAWLTESLLYRAEPLPEDGVRNASRLAAAVLALVDDGDPPCGSALKRVHFFAGRMLNDDELRTEQQYTRRCESDASAKSG